MIKEKNMDLENFIGQTDQYMKVNSTIITYKVNYKTIIILI